MAAHFVEYMRERDLCDGAGYTCPYPRLQELVDELMKDRSQIIPLFNEFKKQLKIQHGAASNKEQDFDNTEAWHELDEITGVALDPKLVKAAELEEAQTFEEYDVWNWSMMRPGIDDTVMCDHCAFQCLKVVTVACPVRDRKYVRSVCPFSKLHPNCGRPHCERVHREHPIPYGFPKGDLAKH